MADETPKVEIAGTVKVEAADPAAALGTVSPPITQKTVETKETTVVTGPAVQRPPPPVIADDNIRKWVAQEAIITDFLLAAGILCLLFFESGSINKDVLPFVTGIIGTIIGYKARDVGTVYGYLFGSSSGSTAKSAILEKK